MMTQSTILLVDDDPTTRKVYELVLSKAGFVVHTAGNGQQALEMLEPGHRYDLVISDLNMPEMDGNELVSQMRAMPRLAMLPLLMLTASEEQDDCLKNLGAGVSDYVVKGRKGSAELLARVANLTRMKRLQDEVERASRTDALTNLANRRHGCERLEEEIERARRYGRDLAVAGERWKGLLNPVAAAEVKRLLVGEPTTTAAPAEEPATGQSGSDVR